MSAYFSGLDNDGYCPLVGALLIAVIALPQAAIAHKHLTRLPSVDFESVQTIAPPITLSDQTQESVATSKVFPPEADSTDEFALESSPRNTQAEGEKAQLSLLQPAGEARPDTPSILLQSGLADVDFDLSKIVSGTGNDGPDQNMAQKSVIVQKPLISSGGSLGSLTISIDENARAFVSASKIKTILVESGSPPARLARIPDQPMISFQRLRELGIDLKYDPIEDHVVLQ